MSGHRQVLVGYKGQEIEVDEAIAPLLEKMWAVGIDTYASCERLNGNGDVRIWFPEEASAKRFQSYVPFAIAGTGFFSPVDFAWYRLEEAEACFERGS